MEELSARARGLVPSATIAMNRRARELAAAGRDVIDLSVGEPDFPTPPFVREAAKAAIDAGYSRYTPVAGYPELRDAVRRKLARENGLDYADPEVMVSCGAKHSIANVLLALVDPGDEVLIPAPYWVSYAELARLAGGIPVILPTRAAEGWKLDPATLKAALGPKSRVLVLCSPSNPTGAVYGAQELAALAAELEGADRLWVLSDEIYEHISMSGSHASPASIPSLRDRCALVNGVSKSYAMTGWRIGYLAAPETLVRACTDIQGQMTTNASSIAQRAAMAALDGGAAAVAEMAAAFRHRRGLALAAAAALPGSSIVPPEGAFYLFPDLSSHFGKSLGARKVLGSAGLCSLFLEEAGVATVPGAAFGEDACVRISFASSEEKVAEGIRRMAEVLSGLR